MAEGIDAAAVLQRWLLLICRPLQKCFSYVPCIRRHETLQTELHEAQVSTAVTPSWSDADWPHWIEQDSMSNSFKRSCSRDLAYVVDTYGLAYHPSLARHELIKISIWPFPEIEPTLGTTPLQITGNLTPVQEAF